MPAAERPGRATQEDFIAFAVIDEIFAWQLLARPSMPAMSPRLLALDLDGTLLPSSRDLPQAHIDLVRSLIRRGIQVAIVTGRPLLTACWPWRALGLDTPLVCFNGVWIGHPEQGAWDEAPLAESDVRAIIAFLRRYAGMTCCYPEPRSWVVDGFIPATADWQERYEVTITAEPERFADWHGVSYKIMFVSEPETIVTTCAAMRAHFGDRYHVVISERDRLEIHQAHATKAWGLQRLAAGFGFQQEEVWAAGDNDNDIEMIAWAGQGFAMGGGSDGVQAVADQHLPPASEHGLTALYEFL